jgi:hypothetical protein
MWEYSHTLKVLPQTANTLRQLQVLPHCESIPNQVWEYSNDVGVLARDEDAPKL